MNIQRGRHDFDLIFHPAVVLLLPYTPLKVVCEKFARRQSNFGQTKGRKIIITLVFSPLQNHQSKYVTYYVFVCLMPSVFSKLSLLLNNFVIFFTAHTFYHYFSLLFGAPTFFITVIHLKIYQKFTLSVVLLWISLHSPPQLIWSTAVCLFACIHSSHLTLLPLLTFRNHRNAKTWPARLQDGWASAFAFFCQRGNGWKPKLLFFYPACVSDRMVEMSRLLNVFWTSIFLHMHPFFIFFPHLIL